jgi:hypothetical protein
LLHLGRLTTKFVYLLEKPDLAIAPGQPTPAIGLPFIRHLMKPGQTELALCTYRVRPGDMVDPPEGRYTLNSVSCLGCKRWPKTL